MNIFRMSTIGNRLIKLCERSRGNIDKKKVGRQNCARMCVWFGGKKKKTLNRNAITILVEKESRLCI